MFLIELSLMAFLILALIRNVISIYSGVNEQAIPGN